MWVNEFKSSIKFVTFSVRLILPKVWVAEFTWLQWESAARRENDLQLILKVKECRYLFSLFQFKKIDKFVIAFVRLIL